MVQSNSAKPVPKVAAGLLAGAITTILIYLISMVAQVVVPPTVAAAMTTLITFLISYMVPCGKDEQVMDVAPAAGN
jgi:hypothetical protein